MKRSIPLLVLGLTAAATTTLLAQDVQHVHKDGQAAPSSAASSKVRDSKLTYAKDIAPLLAQNCQTCHRAGEGTPFSMDKYETVKMWSNNIKRMVSSRRMPPWYDDGTTKKFENDPAMSQSDIDTLVAWVDAGAPQGDPKDMPAPQAIRGRLDDPQAGHRLPTAQALPRAGDRHHGVSVCDHSHRLHQGHVGGARAGRADRLQRRPPHRGLCARPGSNYFKDNAQEPKNEFFEAPPAKKRLQSAPKDDVPNDWLTGYAPGQPPDMFKPGQAKLIPAGLGHRARGPLHAGGQSHDGPVAAGPGARQGAAHGAHHDALRRQFVVQDSARRSELRVDASYTMPEDVTLLGLHPHMHMRGKSAQYRIVFADGKTETLLNVPNYNWRWQLWYDLAEPIKLPKGTKLQCTEHFDNSPNNPENPDPARQ